ncbi:hypothetical protein E4U52_007856 [Claviceps spartinae]|nr:hypothetical protein E4U52_007856 [Claviceps spartinae]
MQAATDQRSNRLCNSTESEHAGKPGELVRDFVVSGKPNDRPWLSKSKSLYGLDFDVRRRRRFSRCPESSTLAAAPSAPSSFEYR